MVPRKSFRRPPSWESPLVERRICELIDFLNEHPDKAFATAELEAKTGLRPQQMSVALVVLEALGRVGRRYDAGRRRYVWQNGIGDRASTVRSPLRTWYTIQEAAQMTAMSEKSLRRKIERHTIPIQHEGRRVLISHATLQRAGLIDNRSKQTRTARAVRTIIDALRRPPRRGMSAWQLSERGPLPRQTTETAMAALSAVGLVVRELEGGVVWRWIGE